MSNVMLKLNKELNFIYKEHMNKVLHRNTKTLLSERDQKEEERERETMRERERETERGRGSS